MDAGGSGTGWYFSKRGGPPGQKSGPFTREQLRTLARSGALTGRDLVWGPGMPDWLPAAQVPGLLMAPGYPPPPPIPASLARGRAGRPWVWPLVLTLVIVVAGAAVVGVLSFGGGWGKTTTASSQAGGVTATTAISTTEASTEVSQTTVSSTVGDLPVGKVEIKLPDVSRLVKTADYGEVPANEIVVLLAGGKTRSDAEAVAQAVKGTVVGELEFLNAYQIETAATTEAELKSDLATVRAVPGVESASPDQQEVLSQEILGVRQSPIKNNLTYAGADGKGYELIGVDRAWTFMRGAGIDPSAVKVGVVDGGLYQQNGAFGGSVRVQFPDQTAGALSGPNAQDKRGSHGTMVSSLIGADPNNGGVTGVASNLGDKLTLSVINKYSPPYGEMTESTPDPNDPTKFVSGGKTYFLGTLAALLKQVDAQAQVINCSFGPDGVAAANADVARAYRAFFEKMAQDHPKVVFVCSAGNESTTISPSTYFPSGAASGLPNVITVGNVDNLGARVASSNTAGTNGEVTLGAPGEQAIQGIDAQGNSIKSGGGTSAATPQVAAAAALLLSLDPKLTAEEVKQILTASAQAGPAEVGGKILRVDEAVRMVINKLRKEKDGTAIDLTADELEKAGVLDSVATSQSDPDTYAIKATLYAVPAEGLTLEVKGTEGAAVQNTSPPRVTAPGTIELTMATISKKESDPLPTITLTRSDNGAASVITFEKIDLNGKWTGTLTITDWTEGPSSGTSGGDVVQGCSSETAKAVIEALKGKPLLMTMDITVDDAGKGGAVTVIDASKVNLGTGTGTKSDPQTFPLTYSGGVVTLELPPGSGGTMTMTGTVTREDGVLVIKGTLTGGASGSSLQGVWEMKQQA